MGLYWSDEKGKIIVRGFGSSDCGENYKKSFEVYKLISISTKTNPIIPLWVTPTNSSKSDTHQVNSPHSCTALKPTPSFIKKLNLPH